MKIAIKYFMITCSLWLIGVLLGILLVNNYEVPTVLNNNLNVGVAQTIIDALDKDDHMNAFVLVARNNLSVVAINIIGGVLFGIPILFSMLFNGFAFGTTYTQMYISGVSVDFMLKYTLPHSFELIAIWWSAAIGLLIVRKLILIIKYSQFPTIKEYKYLVINLVIIIVSIVLAAFVETFVTINI